MTALTEGTDYEIVGVQRGDVYNEIVIRTINTVDDADTLAVDMTKYGIQASGLMGVVGYAHSTANSIVVAEDPTTTVSSGTITLTVTGSTDDLQRYYVVKDFAVPNPSSAI